MWDTRHGIQWPQLHTLLFEEQVAVDMRLVWLTARCGELLQKEARMVYWKIWTAEHECERVIGRSMIGTNPGCAANEHQRIVDLPAPQCDEEGGRGRKMGA